MERMTGSDALLWHMETTDVPGHTLKIVILDTARRGRPLTLADVSAAVEPRLGLVPRSTQRLVAVTGFKAKPFWVDDPMFDLDAHLDERRLPAPGSTRELDQVYAELAEAPLDPTRPLWSLTLVHGLADGRQAVVARVHHALTDGLGALNSFLALTTDTPGTVVAEIPAVTGEPPSRAALRRELRRGALPWLRSIPKLLRDGRASRRRAREFRAERPELPAFLGARRTSLNAASGSARVCATASLPLADFKVVGRASGATVNGVLHTAIAAAVRDELLERGESVDEPTVAVFGIAADPKGSTRRCGNNITPTTVAMASHLTDPIERLHYTAKSCLDGVELRRTTGLEMAGRWADLAPRLGPTFRSIFADRSPLIANHVTTANVVGPASTRWMGDVEVIDWISIAVAVAPANVNLTVYSYDGRMNMGLVATPECLPDPHRFLERVARGVGRVVEAVAADAAPGDVAALGELVAA